MQFYVYRSLAFPSMVARSLEMSIKTVGLCLSARNAKQVILRCLESVRPFVDYVLVEDGGSIDGTQAAVREWLPVAPICRNGI